MLIRCPKKDNFGRSTDNMTHHELVMQRCGPVSILASEKNETTEDDLRIWGSDDRDLEWPFRNF